MQTRILNAFAVPALILGVLALGPNKARADEVHHLEKSLVKVVVDIDARHDLIHINNVNVLDYNFIPITDVLSEDNLSILSVLIEESPIASFNQGFLDDILQFAGVLDQNQIVVGVLSDQGIIYFLDNE